MGGEVESLPSQFINCALHSTSIGAFRNQFDKLELEIRNQLINFDLELEINIGWISNLNPWFWYTFGISVRLVDN
jgi:hypothetical protein